MLVLGDVDGDGVVPAEIDGGLIAAVLQSDPPAGPLGLTSPATGGKLLACEPAVWGPLRLPPVELVPPLCAYGAFELFGETACGTSIAT